jgi:PAS domain-containing protein
MKQTQLTNLFLDQSNDLFWMIDLDFQLIYANKRYLSFMREVSGKEKKLNESVFTEVIDEGYIETWKAYYSKALNGEHFEVEEHVYHQNSDQLQYTQVTFEPLTGEDDKIFAVACQSKDIIRGVTENFSHSEEQNRLIINSALECDILESIS